MTPKGASDPGPLPDPTRPPRGSPAPVNDKSAGIQDTDESQETGNMPKEHNVGRGGYGWVIPIDLIETQHEYIVTADLPGVKISDLRVETEDDMLVIRAKRVSEVTKKEAGGEFKTWSRERGQGDVARAIRLPMSVVQTNCTASFENGVLVVRIKKPAEHGPRKRTITIGDETDSTKLAWSAL